jgi:hypothetical protein
VPPVKKHIRATLSQAFDFDARIQLLRGDGDANEERKNRGRNDDGQSYH